MKALLVTSKITFVPSNYDQLIIGLSDCKHIGGLLILNNQSTRLFLKSVLLYVQGARSISKSLLKNQFGNSHKSRVSAYSENQKPVWTLDSINDPVLIKLVDEFGFDLIINARTRHIYRNAILNNVHFGCINIHHGLLPYQKGTMCDLWALGDSRESGFSIHKMSPVIDGGEIVRVVKTTNGNDHDYMSYLHNTSLQELQVMKSLLDEIERTGSLTATTDIRNVDGEMYKDPKWPDIRQLRRKAITI